MQDRFKLRFWDNLEKVMGEVISIDIDGGIVDYKNEDIVSSTQIKNGNIIQCTGLKDKNGKLIFEGDIVKIEYYDYVTKYRIGTVEWEDDGYGITYFKAKDTKVNGCSLLDFVNDKKEIIGNIYENPELLEVKNVNIQP